QLPLRRGKLRRQMAGVRAMKEMALMSDRWRDSYDAWKTREPDYSDQYCVDPEDERDPCREGECFYSSTTIIPARKARGDRRADGQRWGSDDLGEQPVAQRLRRVEDRLALHVTRERPTRVPASAGRDQCAELLVDLIVA